MSVHEKWRSFYPILILLQKRRKYDQEDKTRMVCTRQQCDEPWPWWEIGVEKTRVTEDLKTFERKYFWHSAGFSRSAKKHTYAISHVCLSLSLYLSPYLTWQHAVLTAALSLVCHGEYNFPTWKLIGTILFLIVTWYSLSSVFAKICGVIYSQWLLNAFRYATCLKFDIFHLTDGCRRMV